MRILQVLNTFGAGGAEQYVIQLSSFMVEQGDRVVVVGCEPFTIKDKLSPEVRVVVMELHPGDQKSIFQYLMKLVPNIFAIYKLIKQEKIELVHTHLAASALPAWIAAKLAGVPVIHSKMHTQIIASSLERFLFLSPLPKWLVSRFLAFSGYIVTEMRKFWRVDDEQIIHSSIGVDADIYDPMLVSRTLARTMFKLPDDMMIVGVVARLYPEKNVDLAITGFAAMANKNAILLIGGDGPQRHELEQIVHKLGIHERVYFLGRQADPRPVYAAADVIMQTTRGPNMGMIALEALAMGVPLLIAARDENEVEMAKDTLGGYDIGWVADASSEAIGRALDNLVIEQSSYRNEMARDYILSRHDKKSVLARLRIQYQELIVASEV
jgi:glycosyltransferase involved in cell wall biosynthesis